MHGRASVAQRANPINPAAIRALKLKQPACVRSDRSPGPPPGVEFTVRRQKGLLQLFDRLYGTAA